MAEVEGVALPQHPFEWKMTTKPPYYVLDYDQKWKGPFDTREEQRAYVERDMKMVHNAARGANEDAHAQILEAFNTTQDGSEVDLNPDGEQAVDGESEDGTSRKSIGGTGNRRTRRRNGRSTDSKKASGRGRRST